MEGAVIDIAALAQQAQDRKAQAKIDLRRDRVTLGVRLNAIRRAAGFTQAQVAERCSMAQGKISDLEAGRKPLSEALRNCLADVYGISIDDLTTSPLQAVLDSLSLGL